MLIDFELKQKLNKFKNNKRAYYSFIFLLSSYIFSLFSPLLANNKPLLLYYNSKLYFPIFFFYSEKTFGKESLLQTDYKKLAKEDSFTNSSNFIIFPPISYGYNEDNLKNLSQNPPTKPDLNHLLGTDDRGRDVLTRILFAYRNAMSFGLTLIFFEMLIGVFIGGFQGYFGGKFDIFMQRVIEILASIPFLYLILIMGSFFGRSFLILVLTYGALSWIGISYYMRGEFYKFKNQDFILAAKVLGIPTKQIFYKHILPNAITPIVTFLPFALISAISVLSALDFLGYGIPAPNPSLGEMIAQGRVNLSAWWLIFFPSATLFFTILFAAFVGEGLRDAFDSKSKITYE